MGWMFQPLKKTHRTKYTVKLRVIRWNLHYDEQQAIKSVQSAIAAYL